MKRFVHPTHEAGRKFVERFGEGPLVMLNLLRFREIADYGQDPELAPETPISGAEAYRRYMAHARPFVEAVGSEVVFAGEAGDYLIGPEDEHWDQVLLVRHPNVAAFLSFASDRGYLSGLGHRTAALADSRLLPITAKM